MKVSINGKIETFEAPLSLYDVIEQQGYVEMMIAVAQNGRFVPREQYIEINLSDGDEIDIVAPMQGG